MIEIEVSRRASLLGVVGLLLGLLALVALSPALRAEAPEAVARANKIAAAPASAAPLEPISPQEGREGARTNPLPVVTPGELQPAPASLPDAPTNDLSTATAQIEGTVTAGALHVRAGPGATYDSLTTLAQGETVRVQGQNEEGVWLQVILAEGQVGWVSAAYVTLESDQPLPTVPTAGGAP